MSEKIKPSFDPQRSILGEILPLETPFRVTLDTSEICNFKCNYCFRSEKPDKSWGYALKNEKMSMEIFETAVEQLLEFPSSPKVIALSGSGEPLYNKHIPEMAILLKSKKFSSKIEIHTNASLLTVNNVEKIAQCGIDKIVISLQGLTSEAYQKTCGVPLDFERFYQNLSYLYLHKSANTDINIKIIDKALFDAEDEKRFYELFESIADSIFIEKAVALWQDQISYDADSNKTSNKFGRNLGEIHCCPIVFTNLTVSPDGNIWPCCVINPPFCLGNIQNTTLLQAWNSSERKEFMRRNLLHGHDCHKQCKNCYFPKGYVKTEQDIIDPYREKILKKLY